MESNDVHSDIDQL